MSAAAVSENTAAEKDTREHYWLKTHAIAASPTKYGGGLYVRQYKAQGVNAAVMTPEPPVYLKSSMDSQQRQLFTGDVWPGKAWGFVMGKPRNRHAWESVEIVENEGDLGFSFEKMQLDGKEVEVLVWNSAANSNDPNEFKGWMVTEWSLLKPQLFWLTGRGTTEELPPHCERVLLVRESLPLPKEETKSA